MKSRGGFTLLEAAVALALWLILSGAVFLVWQHSALSALSDTGMLERQSAFENARITVDALKMNFQMAREITLQTDANDRLQMLTLNQRDPFGAWHDYRIRFNVNTGRLDFGQPPPGSWNEFASGLAEVQIIYLGGRMRIIVKTDCAEPIELEGSVCVRHKYVTVIGGSSP